MPAPYRRALLPTLPEPGACASRAEGPVSRASRPAPLAKRLLRWTWRYLPRTALTYDIGKLVTRTLLQPEREPWSVPALFAGKVPMTLNLGALTANDLYCLDEQYEANTLRLWRRLAKGARGILDVGSHVGAFALLAAAEEADAFYIRPEQWRFVDAARWLVVRMHGCSWFNAAMVTSRTLMFEIFRSR